MSVTIENPMAIQLFMAALLARLSSSSQGSIAFSLLHPSRLRGSLALAKGGDKTFAGSRAVGRGGLEYYSIKRAQKIRLIIHT